MTEYELKQIIYELYKADPMVTLAVRDAAARALLRVDPKYAEEIAELERLYQKECPKLPR